MRTKQEVFDDLYSAFEAETVLISVKLQEEAHIHGIRIEAVERIVEQLNEEEDFDAE